MVYVAWLFILIITVSAGSAVQLILFKTAENSYMDALFEKAFLWFLYFYLFHIFVEKISGLIHKSRIRRAKTNSRTGAP